MSSPGAKTNRRWELILALIAAAAIIVAAFIPGVLERRNPAVGRDAPEPSMMMKEIDLWNYRLTIRGNALGPPKSSAELQGDVVVVKNLVQDCFDLLKSRFPDSAKGHHKEMQQIVEKFGIIVGQCGDPKENTSARHFSYGSEIAREVDVQVQSAHRVIDYFRKPRVIEE